ncbi:trypsin-like peptidase domain-containing protein [Streptomyces sp. NBC_00160]|uniref:trypsin-like serine peptidase n=1 Tax=Streptomyces sp. NBC_00160 TaxID=2903628 RepID=UPI002255338C|nr:trypsin-like peptidase domain-containing protein [Streptomyces sp. NBC_00160]MCX5308852.1 trypsin-like peptidase domain-containing protein [Streptomyces sp. NBC_00160]
MGNTRTWGAAAAAVLTLAGSTGCGPLLTEGRDGPAPADTGIVVHDEAGRVEDRRAAEDHWTGGGIAAVARLDAKDDLVQPAWQGGGSIARTIGRVYASGADGGSGACTATVVGRRTVITAAHCVRTSVEGAPASKATWDQGLYFVPGYENGAGPAGGFTVRRVRMAEDWERYGRDVAMLEMNPGPDGRNISEFTGVQPISFTAKPGTEANFFGYPYTNRVLYCSGVTTWTERNTLLRVPCVMGRGSSGGPYLSGDPAEGSVVAVNVISDDEASYGTALGAFAQRLYEESERGD